MTISPGRTASGGVARPLEVGGVVVAALVIWWLALGWDWSTVQSTFEWTVLGIGAMCGVGWLALRGRAVLGTVGICAPIIFLSGWRMAVAAVADWPVELASLVFALSATCMVAGGIGAWLRWLRRLRRLRTWAGRRLPDGCPGRTTADLTDSGRQPDC